MDGLTLQCQREFRGLNWTLHQHEYARVKRVIRFHMNGLQLESSVGVSCIESLMSLTLMNVRVTGKLLEHLLSNCPLLERLHVFDSDDLVTLKVCGSSLRLNYLHIIRCLEFKCIEIFAPNLESLGLVGRQTEMHVNHAPRLLDVCIGGSKPVNSAICPLSSYLSQLQSLILPICIYPNVSTLTYFFNLLRLRLYGFTQCSLISRLFNSGKIGILKISAINQS